jgi:hypothetical protein
MSRRRRAEAPGYLNGKNLLVILITLWTVRVRSKDCCEAMGKNAAQSNQSSTRDNGLLSK